MPHGRAAVSMNAFSHGFTAKTLIVQNENPDNPDRFNEMLKSYFDYPKPANQIEADLIADMVARWRPRCIWRFETATLDIEMDSQAPDFEKFLEKHDGDVFGGKAFSARADKSAGVSTALRYDIHLSRTYRRSLRKLYRLSGAGLKNKPTEPAKSQLNGKEQALNGDQKQENPTLMGFSPARHFLMAPGQPTTNNRQPTTNNRVLTSPGFV